MWSITKSYSVLLHCDPLLIPLKGSMRNLSIFCQKVNLRPDCNSLPSALRKVLVMKFSEFDEYQLGMLCE